MQVVIRADKDQMGVSAAEHAARVLRQATKEQGHAHLVVATGASQFTVLAQLVAQPDIEWQRVIGFHLDEYIGLPIAHPASFRGYLKQRFVDRVPLQAFHYIDGERQSPADECRRLGELIAHHPIDVALVGIGENGHLAFNDPPADFDTAEPYLVVNLDDACRRQQLGEGWFPSLEAVPSQAISMSIQQILKSRVIICSVPDDRKAKAVFESLAGPVSPAVPASILQRHSDTTVYLDQAAASRLSSK